MKQTLKTEVRPVLRLSEIERLIKEHRILIPAPSRPTLIQFIEEGIFQATTSEKPTRMGWLVYEDSFLRWVDSLRIGEDKKAAK
jgi:hypothetical protein